MRCITNNQIKFKVAAIFVLLAFASTTFASGLSVGRLIPKGKVTLFQGNQKVGEFSSEAPFPEGTLLSVQGECGIKMSDLYLVAIDKSMFSVTTDPDSRKLAVKNGTIYFALSSMPHILVFQTPDGVVTTHQVLLNASSESALLKGYVSVTEDITKVGVLDGGSMLLSVGDGKTMRINAGQELRLAQAGLFEDKEGKKEEPKPKEDKAKRMSNTKKALIGLGTIGAGALLFSGGGGGGGGSSKKKDESSPSTP